MGKSKKNKQDIEPCTKKEGFWNNVIYPVFGAGIIAVFALYVHLNSSMAAIKVTLESIDSRVGKVENKVEQMSTAVAMLNTDFANIDSRLTTVETGFNTVMLDAATRVIAGKELQGTVPDKKNVFVEYSIKMPEWTDEDIIAADYVTGVEYTAKELQNEKLLFTYKSGKQDVLFYGQFNNRNLWDGQCVINVYEGDTLVFIMDAEYDNGELTSYEQMLPFITSRGKSVWAVSRRVSAGDVNTGESWNYRSEVDFSKNFSIVAATASNIISMERFKLMINAPLESYYLGNTQNGMYADTTGNAYLVKYDTNGNVRTLYCGKFRDGSFYDESGNAWYVTRDTEKETSYMYYKGTFINGKPADTIAADNFENPLSEEHLNELIKNKAFKCDLKWDTRYLN